MQRRKHVLAVSFGSQLNDCETNYLSGYTDAFNVKRRTEDGVRQTHQESPPSLVDCWRQRGE